MTEAVPVAVIDGRCGRQLNNALTMTFYDGVSTEPFAKAVQGKADGIGGKLLVLFGFRNGSKGKHVLTFVDGSGRIDVPTLDYGPTLVARDGHPLASILREGVSTATLPDGSVLFRFLPDPVEPVSSDRYRIQIVDAGGTPVGTVDMVRSAAGFDLGAELLQFALEGIDTSTGGSLPLMVLGTRLALYRETTEVERDVLLAVCVELGIAVRAYFAEMGEVTAWA